MFLMPVGMCATVAGRVEANRVGAVLLPPSSTSAYVVRAHKVRDNSHANVGVKVSPMVGVSPEESWRKCG